MWESIKVQTMWLKGSTDLWVIARDNNFSSFIALLFKQGLHYHDHLIGISQFFTFLGVYYNFCNNDCLALTQHNGGTQEFIAPAPNIPQISSGHPCRRWWLGLVVWRQWIQMTGSYIYRCIWYMKNCELSFCTQCYSINELHFLRWTTLWYPWIIYLLWSKTYRWSMWWWNLHIRPEFFY